MTEGHNVRLTIQAHRVCTEEAKRCGTSMKAVASEAIFLASHDMIKDPYADEKYLLALQSEQARKKIEQGLKAAKRRTFRLLFATSVVAGCLGILIGVML